MRFGVCTLALVVLFCLFGGSADSARTQGGADWTLKQVAPNQKWLRVTVQGETLYGFRVRGTDFAVTGIKSVRVSGGAMPQCSVTGTPATLACDGDLVGGISVFVHLATTGSGGAYDFAFLFAPGDTNLIYVPSQQTAPPVPVGGSLGMTSPTHGRVTIRNLSTTTFQQLEIAPIGFSVKSVATTDCGVTEGSGIACNRPLAPGQTAAIRFGTTSVSGRVSAYLIGVSGGTTAGFAFVQAGDPCPDMQAALAGSQAQRTVLEKEIAKMNRALHEARAPVTRLRIMAMKATVGKLERRLRAVRAAQRVQQDQLHGCTQGSRRLAAASSCDPQWEAAARTAGTVKALKAALPIERRVAAGARPLLVRVKKLGPSVGANWKSVLVHLTTLSRLPRKTGRALTRAKAAVRRAESALTRCNAALDQG